MSERIEQLLSGLPDPEAARRFLGHLAERSSSASQKLLKNDALTSDVLTLVSFSPLLATTLLQNPEYIAWLDRKRREGGVRTKDELLESLGQFSLTNSQLEPQLLFARFRRRELLRIYLRDIRRLATIAEITEEISVLADAVLESVLRLARNEMDARYGQPLETDKNGKSATARFCVAALGKLGSRELNYSSDIDLLFIYSSDGSTSGSGTRGQVTNREYFVKLAEYLTKLVGHPSGEGAAYRVDLRLRPHGSLGPLAQSVDDMVRYYCNEARAWERQVMIRSRASAGDAELFRDFFARIEDLVFSRDGTPGSALLNVRRSKEQIDEQQTGRSGFDVKLGRGGIREIEFIAQALQLAHGGRDAWLRAPHTLISLGRLKEHGLISEKELTELVAAYEFLRRTEHILQMENGVQTHAVPDDVERRQLLARRTAFAGQGDLEKQLAKNTANVARIFARVLPKINEEDTAGEDREKVQSVPQVSETMDASSLEKLRSVSPHFAAISEAHPGVLRSPETSGPDYNASLMKAVDAAKGDRPFRSRLAAIRECWLRCMLGIVTADAFGEIDLYGSKRQQTELAEASIAAGIEVVRRELQDKNKTDIANLQLSVLALGKLGGGAVDYDSDLDLVFVYNEAADVPSGSTPVEFFSRATELFVTTMSSMTREGSLYRVDLRLRPYGSKGLSAMGSNAFLEYIRDKAAIWEMLAFVKLRAVGGDLELGRRVEEKTRSLIHERAAATHEDELRSETIRVRDALEEQRARTKRGGDVDIKYGAGGMLDVYFAMRYLQLRHNVPDGNDDRSTTATLERLRSNSSLTAVAPALVELKDGYAFLSALDHAIRLTVGRKTRLPSGNVSAMELIAKRLDLGSPAELVERLTVHRLAVREAYDRILFAATET
jgi:glutamine synthetase adenylyltransferase